MNLLFSCIGKRGYIAQFFRESLAPGDRIIGTSNTKWTPGFRYCDRNYLLPDITSSEYPDRVLELCRQESIAAVFSFYDPDVQRLSGIAAEFKKTKIIPVLPSEPVSTICFDKFQTFQFLAANGFDTPKTYLDMARIRQDLDSGDLSFPLIVKPRFGFGSSHTYVANNQEQLAVFFKIGPQMIVQPKVGGDDYDFDICNDLAGKPLSVILWRKFRSTMGETENVITVQNDHLVQVGERLGRTLGHVGPMDVDMFVDDFGNPTIIEMNPRFGGGYPVSHLAGADFPGMLIRLIKGEQVAPRIGDYRAGTVMMKSLDVFGGADETFWSEQLHLAASTPSK